MLQGNVGKAYDGIHGSTYIVGHVVQECALCSICILSHKAQLIKLPVCLLLQFHHLSASLHPDKTDKGKKQHNKDCNHEEQRCPEG